MHVRVLALAAAFAIAGTPALADRAPNDEERAAVEEALSAEGFTHWDDIEMEDDEAVWEVDDAIDADGEEFDLELDAETLEILERDPD